MSSRMFPMFLLLTVACSGSSAFVSPAERPDEPPATAQPAEPSASASSKRATEQDAAVEPLIVPDASPQDASSDAHTDVDVPDTPRFGLGFGDAPGERTVADLPLTYQAGGALKATWEGWFKHDGFQPDALPNTLNGRLFSAGYNVECRVVSPDPDASEAGKVQCDAFGQASIRSLGKPAGWFHLALTFDSGGLTMYVDGQPQGSATVSEGVLRPEPPEFGDTSVAGNVFFGATSADKRSGRLMVDEFRLSPTRRYVAAFAPQKHLDGQGADLLLLLDDGVGPTSDGGKARLHNAAWVTVAR